MRLALLEKAVRLNLLGGCGVEFPNGGCGKSLERGGEIESPEGGGGAESPEIVCWIESPEENCETESPEGVCERLDLSPKRGFNDSTYGGFGIECTEEWSEIESLHRHCGAFCY